VEKKVRGPSFSKALSIKGRLTLVCLLMTSVLHFTTNKAPFTLQGILGTARIKVVRVPKRIVLISHLHVLSSTVLNDVK